MKLEEARARCPDILMVEKSGRNTCAHLEKPYCRLPSRLFCVFYEQLTGGGARRIDEPPAPGSDIAGTEGPASRGIDRTEKNTP